MKHYNYYYSVTYQRKIKNRTIAIMLGKRENKVKWNKEVKKDK